MLVVSAFGGYLAVHAVIAEPRVCKAHAKRLEGDSRKPQELQTHLFLSRLAQQPLHSLSLADGAALSSSSRNITRTSCDLT